MSAAIPIYEGQDFYVPYFDLRLRGRRLDRDVARDIRQVTYKDNIAEIDSFEFTVNNWDAERRDFKYSDETLFDPGSEVELWMGYYGAERLRLMLRGEITSLRPSFPAAGQPTLTISGLNLLHRLRKEQVSRAYIELKDSEIATQIARGLGVTIQTDPTAINGEERYQYLFQDNQYDIIFLMERARRIGYDLFVIEGGQDGQASQSTLYFGPSVDVRRITYRLTYGASLIEFQPTLTTANQVGEVTVRGWDPVRKEKIEQTAKRNEIKTKGVGSRGGQASIEQSFNQRKEVIATRPISSKQEAKTLAIETLERIAKDMVTGSGSVVGLPDLRAGRILEIDGLGTRFSGRYFVTATTHTIGDSGYTTQFECRREELQGN
jgi:phage protein D